MKHTLMLILFWNLLWLQPVFGHEENSVGVMGPGKAVLEAKDELGFKLSDVAARTLGLAYKKVTSSGLYRVPSSSLVFYQEKTGIYRIRNGWIKLIEVSLHSRTEQETSFTTRELKVGDQIATEGVPFLRLTDLDIHSQDSKHD